MNTSTSSASTGPGSKAVIALCALVLALLAGSARASEAPAAQVPADAPSGVVQRLLEHHYAGDHGFTPRTVAAKAVFLSAALVQAAAGYFAQPFPADEAPPINGDPFTDSQEIPARFAVGRATVEGAHATVPVRFADGERETLVHYRLVRAGPDWRVDDVIDGSGDSLRRVLKMPPP